MIISIIIPVYKVEQYVRKCIESIIDQDDGSASLECIIVDDSSPDNSISIIHSIVDNYQGNITFVFLKHQENKGLSAARNTGINAIHGDYAMFVDSDDWLPTCSISRFVQALHKNPEIDMIIGLRYDTKEKSIFPDCLTKEMQLDNYQIRKFFLNNQIVSGSAWNKLIKTHIVKNNKFHEGIIYEDTPWAYFLFKNINNALVIPYLTYIYENNHPNSIINTAENRQNVSTHMRSINYIGNTILDSTYSDLFADSLIHFFRFFIVAFHLNNKYHCENEEFQPLMKLRKRIITTSLKKGRLFLSFFFFTLCYPPTSFMFNIGWTRRHYYNIEKIGRVIANFLERFHQK
ncbi:MAG: glycosyltransferase family 2 protein [Prevotella sp.]|nr:glycosyltransferase family 2 protein [Prevotella sp.]